MSKNETPTKVIVSCRFSYNSNGNRGVAAGLGNIQKLKDGEALSSRTNAEDDFEAVEDEDFLG